MGNPHRPPCPRCGQRMWRSHRKFGLVCPKCGLRVRVDDPRLVLHTLSDLADARAQYIVSTRGGWP